MDIQRIHDEQELLKWCREFLGETGFGRALVVVPDSNLLTRLRQFLADLGASHRYGHFSICVGERLIHLTALLPSKINAVNGDIIVFYLPRLLSHRARDYWTHTLGMEP